MRAQAPASESGGHRTQLLAFATDFVAAAAKLAGVRRIALIGSLATPKANPKDVDLLVEITDAVDLTQLATLARRLQGRAQTLNRGADVFLSAADGTYLGRTCPWRECRPGLRSRCDADHCGRRPHLHDDLATVCLPRSVITAPPIELWPRLILRTTPPPDVSTWLQTLPAPAEP